MRRLLQAFVAAVTLLAIGIPPALAEDPGYIVIGGGTWQTLRDQDRTAEFDIAYRSPYRLWIFKPHFGALVAKDGDVYGYGGLLTDIYWGPHFVTTLSTAVGIYGGNGFDLGSHVEFRSGIDLAWRFDNSSRLGVGFYHISNAGLTSRNPGSESLLLQYSLPVSWLLGK